MAATYQWAKERNKVLFEVDVLIILTEEGEVLVLLEDDVYDVLTEEEERQGSF